MDKKIIFSYPALVTFIDSVTVTVLVSINGRDIPLIYPLESFNFQVVKNMKIICEGVEVNKRRHLHFRKWRPIEFTSYQIELLGSLVDAFNREKVDGTS